MGYPKAAGQGQLRAILFADFLTPSCSKPRKKTPRIRGAQQRRENENMTSESYSFLTALNYLADLLCSRSSSCWIFGSFFFPSGFSIYLSESGQSGCFLSLCHAPNGLFCIRYSVLFWQRFPFARGQHLNSFF